LKNAIVTDDIDLSSPTSRPAPEIVPSTSHNSNVGFELTRKPEQLMMKQDNTE